MTAIQVEVDFMQVTVNRPYDASCPRDWFESMRVNGTQGTER